MATKELWKCEKLNMTMSCRCDLEGTFKRNKQQERIYGAVLKRGILGCVSAKLRDKHCREECNKKQEKA